MKEDLFSAGRRRGRQEKLRAILLELEKLETKEDLTKFISDKRKEIQDGTIRQDPS